MKKFSKIVASLSCIAMLSSVNSFATNATVYCGYNTLSEDTEITLNDGGTYTMPKSTPLITDDDGNVLGYCYHDGDTFDIIYKGELYEDAIGFPSFDENDELIGLYNWNNYLSNYDEFAENYNLPNNAMIYFTLDNEYDGYEVSETIDTYSYSEITLPNGEVVPIDGNNKITYRYDADGNYVSYTLSRVSIPVDDDPEPAVTTTVATTLGESDDNGLYSEPTNIRGDVNYDGLVNNIDVMLLRKYILHMIEW